VVYTAGADAAVHTSYPGANGQLGVVRLSSQCRAGLAAHVLKAPAELKRPHWRPWAGSSHTVISVSVKDRAQQSAPGVPGSVSIGRIVGSAAPGGTAPAARVTRVRQVVGVHGDVRVGK
jgi:hypothetical protein